MRNKLIASLGAAAIIGLGAYWYWSPYLAMNGMRNAVREADADRLNAYIDYPQLRESVKGQLSAAMLKEITAAATSGNAMERAGASLGGMLGLAMVDGMVNALVRPEVVMLALQSGKLRPAAAARGETPSGKPAAPAPTRPAPQWQVERKGADLVVIHAANDPAPAGDKTGFVLAREGFAQWKLTEIRLPAPAR